MDPDRLYSGSSVLIVAGKGGVGKTTVTAAIGLAAARRGRDVLLFGLGDPREIPALFGSDVPLTASDAVLETTPGGGSVRARELTPDAILLEYLVEHGFGRVAKRLGAHGTLDVVASAVPGIREVLLLGKIKQLERRGAADLFILDAPASGHAVRFLTSAAGLADASRNGPLRTQADAARELLLDPERCRVVLVTLAEETPVNEVIETAFRIDDEVGTALGPVVVNDCLPFLNQLDVPAARAASDTGMELDETTSRALSEVAAFRFARQTLQREQLGRLGNELPLPSVVLPHIFTAHVGREQLELLADALDAGLELLR